MSCDRRGEKERLGKTQVKLQAKVRRQTPSTAQELVAGGLRTEPPQERQNQDVPLGGRRSPLSPLTSHLELRLYPETGGGRLGLGFVILLGQ